MGLCINVLPQAQNKFSFPHSQNKLNAIMLRERGKEKTNRLNKKKTKICKAN